MRQSYTVLENFIVLEGLDGSGTTTQLELIKDQFETLAIPFFSTSEPTHHKTGVLIREILKGEHKAHPYTVAFLFAADRNEHLYAPGTGIISHLSQGEIVVCDRYLFSSLAYQSVAADFDFIYSINAHFPLPAIAFFLDTPVPLCIERMSGRKSRDIYEHAEFQEEVLAGYKKAFNFFNDAPFQIHTIDGTLPREKVFLKIWEKIESLPIVKR